MTITPSRRWGGQGMLGVTIRFDTYFEADQCLVRVLDVAPGSPAQIAGLKPEARRSPPQPHPVPVRGAAPVVVAPRLPPEARPARDAPARGWGRARGGGAVQSERDETAGVLIAALLVPSSSSSYLVGSATTSSAPRSASSRTPTR